MPGWMERPIDRKSFLRASSAMLAGSMVQWIGVSHASASMEATNRFALLSDTHIAADAKDQYRGFYPSKNLAAVIEEVRDTPFDMAFINGDAARLDGKPEDYDHLKKLLKPLADHCPVSIGLGNHDDRDHFRKAFSPVYGEETKGNDRHISIVDSRFARWIVLDSLYYVNKAAGFLGKSQRQWLVKYLEQAKDKPVLIMVHHTLGDNDGELLDANHLLQIAKNAPQVKAIFYGHSHQYHVKKEGGCNLINLPAVGYNFSDKEPVGWVECSLHAGGMNLKLHAIAGDQSKNGEASTIHWA